VKAYVDESGDEGTGGNGSRWLVFACIIDTSPQADLPTFIDLAAAKIQRNQAVKRLPHFQDLQHRDKKGILDLYAQASWDGIVVASDTQQILPGSPLGTPKRHYDYALRHVLERASQRARQAGEDLTFILEARRNFDVEDFRRYVKHLREKQSGKRNGHMCWEVVAEERILVALPAQEPILCVADAMAHALFKALEPDREWGDYEMAYAEKVRHHLWRGSGTQPQLLGHGLTFMPIGMTATFLTQYLWVTEWSRGG
jgi:hypothetical protein